MQCLRKRRWKMHGEDRDLGRRFWAVKHRTAGSKGWLSPAKVPLLQPRAPARLYLLFQFPAPTAVKALLPGKGMLSLTCLWPYLCKKLLCLSPCLERLLHLSRLPTGMLCSAPARQRSDPLVSVSSRRGAATASDTSPVCLWTWQREREAGDTLCLLSPSFDFF